MIDPQLSATLDQLLQHTTAAAHTDVDPEAAQPIEAAPGAHALIAHQGRVVAQARAGSALLFSATGAVLPVAKRTGLPADPLFDVASLTKVMVAATALTQARAGHLALPDPVSRYLPAFASGPEKKEVTLAHLLTHTSGLPPVWKPWAVAGDRRERADQLMNVALEQEPGVKHTYSCVGYQVLGLALEQVSGSALPDLIANAVTGPLQMSQTSYAPSEVGRVLPTEYQEVPEPGLVHARVHDEAARSLGGAGNAGLFSTAGDLLTFGEAVRTGAAPLDDQIRRLLHTDTLTGAQRDQAGYGQAIGFRVDQDGFMGSGPSGRIGHTGYTGTSLVIDPARELTIVLLTNRVHPYRTVFEVTGLRRRMVDTAAQWVDSTTANGLVTPPAPG